MHDTSNQIVSHCNTINDIIYSYLDYHQSTNSQSACRLGADPVFWGVRQRVGKAKQGVPP